MIISKHQATEADREFARSVHHRAYRDVVERQYGLWDVAAQDQFFDAAWSADDYQIVLCDAVRCGYCCVENRNDEILIRELVIDPDFQCLGIGTRILQDVLNDSTARSVPVRLQTQILNRATALYRRLGFRESDRTDTHVLMEWHPQNTR